jgi:hypothetical protein
VVLDVPGDVLEAVVGSHAEHLLLEESPECVGYPPLSSVED